MSWIRIVIDSDLIGSKIKIKISPFVFDVWGNEYSWRPRSQFPTVLDNIELITVKRNIKYIDGKKCYHYTCS